MAVFQSKYRELSFYVNGEKHSFSCGSYSTDDTKVIAVLETLTDATRIDESEPEAPKAEQSKKEDETKTEDKPKSRKSSAK
ncbi:hypothetical protein [Paenibacillus alvei]|uniref:hypothetical protein n=1 Tax=Paenibacillus alvei TaxID=44250 RepID=UPI0018CECC72|nr:hypothetical protein [Paenibacillus alvei]MBG9736536.1 hypothetical protein [Paenibacillus alvei]MBG9747160.1 hypothetical protein [Paenibacillus alvei]MCY9582444.1 hypothetical protein [Paenibacillus alvei]MCY9587348.1 hypothetical protein [Paenibacillus alvei]